MNCAAPGFILTRLHTKKLKKDKSGINKRKKLNVLNEVGDPNEVASVIECLISDKIKFITGELLELMEVIGYNV